MRTAETSKLRNDDSAGMIPFRPEPCRPEAIRPTRLIGCAVTIGFKLVFGGRKGDSQLQRGCDAKPTVAARRLPWVVVHKPPQPQGGCGNPSPRVARAFGRNPVGVVKSVWIPAPKVAPKPSGLPWALGRSPI